MDDRPDWSSLPDQRHRLLALARHCGCTAEDAQDVVQEALLRAAHHPPRQLGALKAFLDRTVRRLAVDLHREQLRRLRLAQHTALHPNAAPSHEDQICDRAEAAWISSHTSTLRPRERQVLLARAAGHTTARIARDLDTTTKTVEMLIRRSRQSLHTALAGGQL